MKTKILLLILLAGTISANAQSIKTMNPFFENYKTHYKVPPFDQIRNEHFKPAIQKGIDDQSKEIKTIANNRDETTFDNTILAMEKSGDLLYRANTVFSNLNSANTNTVLQDIAREISPQLTAHHDNIYLNDKLFKRVKAIWDKKESMSLNDEQQMLLKKIYNRFVRGGANLSEKDKQQFRAINSDLSLSTLKYGQNVLAETNSYELVITNPKELIGLPKDLVNQAAADAESRGKKGKWVFTLSNSSVMPFLQYSGVRELRQKIWNAYQMRGNNNNEYDNKELAVKIANLRSERARLLGYKSHADYGLEESMAKTPDKVIELLSDLWQPALENAKIEAADIQKMMLKEGIKDKVQPYDWRFYTEKIRNERFNLDEQELKPYFSLENVRKGVFKVTENLYGLKFKQLSDVPKYHEDVTVWEVTEANGTHVGVLYMDFHPRDSKRGGAWMTSYRSQSSENGKRNAPVISIVCNFTKPGKDAPALLTFDEVTTFFHEFGHALHGLLSDVSYKTLSGTSVSRDFVELPSQVMENWAAEPEVLKMYAKHYKTGEIIPNSLIEKLQKTATFDQGFATTEYLAASFLDMAYHSQEKEITVDAMAFETDAMKRLGLIDAIIPRYRSTYFTHIFSGGYSAGYYSYIWSGVLDSDAFDAFKTTKLFNPELAASFRKNILERGGTEEPMVLYKKFRGSEPSVQPLLRKRGLDRKPPALKVIKG